MSKKSQWRYISCSEEYKLMTPEEKEVKRKERLKERRFSFKTCEKVRRMEVSKPKFNKPSSHKNTKEKEEEEE